MSYISDILDRVSVRKISRFFLISDTPVKDQGGDYKNRLDTAYDDIINFLKEKYTDEKEFMEMESRVNAFSGVHENVYMEIGMRCGARLTADLLEKE